MMTESGVASVINPPKLPRDNQLKVILVAKPLLKAAA
jgi:hypothetical protein